MTEAAYHGICKRKADPNYALDNTPDPKRILQASECMNEEEEEEDWFVDGYCAPQDNRNRLDDFFNNEKFIKVLADKVINHTQLKAMISDLMDSLRRACVHGELGPLASKLRDLIHYPDFIQACLDTYLEGRPCYHLKSLMDIYLSDKQPHERLEKLRADHHLDSLLKETESIRITRVVLSVLFGYWSDYAFNENVYRAISSHSKKNKPPPPTGPTFTRSETVVGIDYPASIEGLKEVFVTRYPVDEAKIICEEIDRLTYIPEFFTPDECKRIKWLMFTLSKNKLVVHTVGFSDYEGGIW